MFVLSIAVMFAGGAALPNYKMPSRPTTRARCAGKCASRYRMQTSSEDNDASKYRALSEDGTDCNVTRAKICRAQPTTWVKANL